MQELKDKTVLVTGGGRSLGREISLHMAKIGANVAVNYNKSAEGAEEVCSEIADLGCKSFSVQADISSADSVREMVQKVVSEFGRIDILVNNAALNIDALIRRMDEEAWTRVLDVTLTGTFHTTREVIPVMREQRWGRIINISSVAAYSGAPGAANYAAAKMAIIGFTRSLAREVARYEITANAVAPGYFDIGMGERLPEKFQTALTEMIPLGRFGQPKELTAAIAFLASENASYITGQVLHVNGGFYM